MGPVPRPLLIVIVVLVLFGVLSCGVSGLKGPPDLDDLSLPFDAQPIPASEVESTGCKISDDEIMIWTSCDLSIVGQAFPPRELRLLVVAGTAEVTVLQQVRGQRPAIPPDDFGPSSSFEVSAAGEGRVRVRIVCVLSCRIQVLR